MTDIHPAPAGRDTGAVRSRRALLGAGLGAAAAAVAGTFARPQPVAATVTAMSTGTENVADATTGLVYDTTGTVLYVATAAVSPPVGLGTFGVVSDTGTGIGITQSATGGWGSIITATGADSIGLGIFAVASGSKGIQVDGATVGVQASGQGTGATGVIAEAFGAGSRGVSAFGAIGVLGEAQNSVTGAIGVKGSATSGTGGEFVATTGTALRATGKVRFNRSGTASVPAGRTYVDVTVTGGITSGSMGFAVLRTYRSGVHVAAVYRVSSTGKLRIRLNKVASSTSSTSVSWMVLG